MVKLHDLEFEPFISEEEIDRAIETIAGNLNRDFGNDCPVFIGVLNGCFMFASEVIKRFAGDCEVSFVKLGSYQGTQSTGDVKTLVGLNQDLKGRTVILLEDIVDTGNTLVEINQILNKLSIIYGQPGRRRQINIQHPDLILTRAQREAVNTQTV